MNESSRSKLELALGKSIMAQAWIERSTPDGIGLAVVSAASNLEHVINLISDALSADEPKELESKGGTPK